MFEHAPPVTDVDVLESPDAVAAELATSLPRGEDMSALLMLDPQALSDAGRVDLLVAFERHIALLQAAQQRVLASLDGRALDWSGTTLVDYTREQVGAALRLSPGTAERIIPQIPLGRLGTPDEVARVIYALCAETASYVNGAEIHINGGQHV